MEYIKLGNSDLTVSRICLGSATWGNQNSEAQSHEQMDYALNKGVNFIDTAEIYPLPPSPEAYGRSEEMIGNWLQSRKNRNDIVLATKVSPRPWARNENDPKINRENIIMAVDGSLQRLKTDYIDLYQLHWPTNRDTYHFSNWWDFDSSNCTGKKQAIIDNHIEILETLSTLSKEGKIKHIGLSNDTSWGIKSYCDLSEKYNLPKIVSVQNEYSLLRRRDETDLMEACSLEGVSYLSWSPLEMGVISGKYLNGLRPEGARFSGNVLHGYEDGFSSRITTHLDASVQAYIDIAKNHNLDVCQMAIAFTLRNKNMSCSIIGATTMDQLKSNIDSHTLKLSDEVLNDINMVQNLHPTPLG